MPASVIRAARRHLRGLEQREINAGPQSDLFLTAELAEPEPFSHPALTALAAVDPDNLSPREALEQLYALKKLAEKEA